MKAPSPPPTMPRRKRRSAVKAKHPAVRGGIDAGRGEVVEALAGDLNDVIADKGRAFAGAVASRPGKFQAADKGTLFLDEIGELPLNLQVKLLRALQERVVFRVGDSKPEKVVFEAV